MNLNQRKDQLTSFLRNQGAGYKKDWKELARRFDLPTAEIARHAWRRYLKNIPPVDYDVKQPEVNGPRITEMKEDLKTGKGEVTIESNTEIRSLQDLLSLIDTDKWTVTKYIQNFWSGKYGVKAWLEPKGFQEAEAIEKLLKNYKPDMTPIDKRLVKVNQTWDEKSLLVLNLNDLHFDKLDLSNNSIDKRIDDFLNCLEQLTLKAYHSSQIEEILFIIGNDMFNTDNIHNMTTNGTPQGVNTTWDVAYEKVFDAMVKAIYFLKNYCKSLNVTLVSGNHDRTKSFYLAHGLEVMFKKEKDIYFDRSSKLKKTYVYGNTFIGMNHGNNVNDKLPLAFATEFAPEWGQCKYHDILISDKHHNNEKQFRSNQTQNEFQGVRVRILPSLSESDKWHDDNLYHSRQSGIALIYGKERGKTAEFEHQI